MTFYYGIESRGYIDFVINTVCLYLGTGKENAKKMLKETCAVETQLGTFEDRHPDKLGVGAYQFDQIALDDLKKETDTRHKRKVKRLWGYDIDTIALKDLADDFLLATICCRLKYLRIPQAIPDNYLNRGVYWKKYYNTSKGKGTIEHYYESVEYFHLEV